MLELLPVLLASVGEQPNLSLKGRRDLFYVSAWGGEQTSSQRKHREERCNWRTLYCTGPAHSRTGTLLPMVTLGSANIEYLLAREVWQEDIMRLLMLLHHGNEAETDYSILRDGSSVLDNGAWRNVSSLYLSI